MGEHSEAMAYQQKAVLMSERVNGIDHPYTITEYTHLALYCFANSQISMVCSFLTLPKVDNIYTTFCLPHSGAKASLPSPVPIAPGARRKPPRGCPDRLQHRPDPPRRRRVRLVPQVPREGLGAQPKVPRTKVTQGKQSVTLVEYSQFTECIYQPHFPP